jgi:hypothetical protein
LAEQLLAIGFGVTVLLGAYAMNKREYPGLARAGSVLACVPVSPVWVITFPLGLCAAFVMRRPEVRAAFDQPLGDATRGLSPHGSPAMPLWRPPSLRSVEGWSLLLCLAGALITFLPWYRETIFSFTATVTGLDAWHERITGGAFAVALILLVVCELRQAGAWLRGLILIAAGGIAVAVTGYDLWQVTHPAQPSVTTSASGDMQVFGDFAKSLTKSFTDMMSSFHLEPLVGPYAAIVCGAAVLGLGVWQLRRKAAEPRVSQLDKSRSVYIM